ncbi:MAG: LuxR C-terminal-related transcriptional regulator [Sulfurimonas sp.]
MKIVLHSDDINLLEYWQKSCHHDSIMIDDLDDLRELQNSIIIVNYSALGNLVGELIVSLSKAGNLILVLHRIPDIDTAREVLGYGAKGYGNALMKEHFIISAIETIQENMIWLHPEFTSQLITQIPAQEDKNIFDILEKLSHREKEVAMLLKDGDTYKVVAQKLSITPRTVKAHAQSIYAKLHVKDRLALALLLK